MAALSTRSDTARAARMDYVADHLLLHAGLLTRLLIKESASEMTRTESGVLFTLSRGPRLFTDLAELAGLAQAPARVGVVGLGVGPGLALAVVVAAGDAIERGIRDQAQRGLDALLERGDGAAPRRQHHLGGHVGRGVQAVRGDAVARVALGDVERVHDLRKLALAVGLDAVVATLEHHVVEVDRRLTGGRDGDDPGRRRADEKRLEDP